MILPIGHDRATVLRWPVISFTLLLLNLIVFSQMRIEIRTAGEVRYEQLRSVLQFLLDHPWVEVDERLGLPAAMRRELAAVREAMREAGELESVASEYDQERFDELVETFLAQAQKSPLYRWGFVPAEPSFATAFTSMFVHAGWLHLLGNLLLLYLMGPPLEDVWGRPVFVVLYLIGGLLAIATHAAFSPAAAVPLVGASGAIAALMGAFLVRFVRSRLRMLFLVPPFFKTFFAPAWVVLPLWLFFEILAVLGTAGDPRASGGVANLAHVGGFGLGLGVALLLRVTGVERKVLRPAVGRKTGLLENDDVEEIYELLDGGRGDEAWELVHRRLEAKPLDFELDLTLWRVAKRLERTGDALPRLVRAVHRQLRQGADEAALVLVFEMLEVHPDLPASPGDVLRLAEALVAREQLELAQAVTRTIDPAGLPEPLAERLQRLPGARLDSAGTPEPAADPQHPEPARLQCLEAEPYALSPQQIAMEAGGKRVGLPLDRIAAVALARVEDPSFVPYSVLDLVLRSAPGSAVRVVRVLSSRWDGAGLVGGTGPAEQLEELARWVERQTGCARVVVGPNEPRSFASLLTYERALSSELTATGLAVVDGPAGRP